MMKATILVCALSLPQPECNKQTATHVILAPETKSYAECGFVSQAFAADLVLTQEEDHYLKIVCQMGDRPVEKP